MNRFGFIDDLMTNFYIEHRKKPDIQFDLQLKNLMHILEYNQTNKIQVFCISAKHIPLLLLNEDTQLYSIHKNSIDRILSLLEQQRLMIDLTSIQKLEMKASIINNYVKLIKKLGSEGNHKLIVDPSQLDKELLLKCLDEVKCFSFLIDQVDTFNQVSQFCSKPLPVALKIYQEEIFETSQINLINYISRSSKVELQPIIIVDLISKNNHITIDTKALFQLINLYQLQNYDFILISQDKQLSCIKCNHVARMSQKKILEKEWAKYKYTIMERSQKNYLALRKMFNESTVDVLSFYELIDESLFIEFFNYTNATMHVWGYFKKNALTDEISTFKHLIEHDHCLKDFKVFLYDLAVKYQVMYLLNSYYFYY